jgi:hypothetical protein
VAEAEKLKLNFAAAKLSPTEAGQVDTHLSGARQRWQEAVMEFLLASAGSRPLPRKIYLTGGGSLLPGLDKLLRANPAPFDRVPEVAWLGALSLPAIKDLTNSIDYHLFTLALSLTAGLPE